MKKMIPVGVSARHIHLSQEHVEALFGKGATLTKKIDLSQPGQYACEEQLDVVSLHEKGKTVERVRVLGPVRKETQVEILRSDATKAKIEAPVRSSGDIEHSGGCKLVNSKNGKEVIINKGVIVADRHIHMSEEEGKEFGIVDKQVVSVKVEGRKGGIMHEVLCRVHPEFKLDFHIDVDDACAFDVKQGQELEIIIND